MPTVLARIFSFRGIIIILALAALVGGGLFYWYEWRPAKVKQECAARSKTVKREQAGGAGVFSRRQIRKEVLDDDKYELCLRERGL